MRALICGVGGQDGAYLTRFLLDKGYEVWGTSRDPKARVLHNLKALQVHDRVRIASMTPTDFQSVMSVMRRVEPDELYYLAGQSSVGLSFEQPVETLESIAVGSLNVLEAIRALDMKTKVYHASSGECFGDVGATPATERTPFHPRSPYALAKASAHWLVAHYREAYGVYGCNGILFNHESPFRPDRFVTRKIADTAIRIARGSAEKLLLGRLDVVRDWGWAPEYVEAMWMMLQRAQPSDYVIATGVSVSLREFVREVFATLELDSTEHVESDSRLYRPSDIARSAADPGRATTELGWEAKVKMPEVARRLTRALEQSDGAA